MANEQENLVYGIRYSLILLLDESIWKCIVKFWNIRHHHFRTFHNEQNSIYASFFKSFWMSKPPKSFKLYLIISLEMKNIWICCILVLQHIHTKGYLEPK